VVRRSFTDPDLFCWSVWHSFRTHAGATSAFA
jgi:hypothetical protein